MHQHTLFEGVTSEFGLVGNSPQIHSVLRIIRKLKDNTSPVLISGESGVGKELVARALHDVSPLAKKIFLPVDSATLVNSLMESELFGHVKGSFTDAIDHKAGLVREAEGGTLFLDEIGELSLGVQAKLLRLLQEGEIRPIGAKKPLKVNVRVVAATNRDLAIAIQEGAFRRDLYYRLRVISIRVPPLRERKSDILPLANHFLAKHALHQVRLSDAVIDCFMKHDWPGNVRELENAVRSMVALKSNPLLQLNDLPSNLRQTAPDETELQEFGGDGLLPLEEVERRHILKTMQYTKGDVLSASLILGIGRTTLYRKLRKYRDDGSNEHDPQGRLFR